MSFITLEYRPGSIRRIEHPRLIFMVMMSYLGLLAVQVEDMEEELDQDTTSALDGIVGSYEFSKEQLQVFEELVGNMRGAAWGIAAATGVTVVLSATKQAS